MHIERCVPLTLAVVAAFVIASCRRPIPAAPDRDAIAATVQGFHDAVTNGDRAAAMGPIAEFEERRK